MNSHQLGLLNHMAFGILDRLGYKAPSEEEIRSIEAYLSQFMIIPYSQRQSEKDAFKKKLADLEAREKNYFTKSPN